MKSSGNTSPNRHFTMYILLAGSGTCWPSSLLGLFAQADLPDMPFPRVTQRPPLTKACSEFLMGNHQASHRHTDSASSQPCFIFSHSTWHLKRYIMIIPFAYYLFPSFVLSPLPNSNISNIWARIFVCRVHCSFSSTPKSQWHVVRTPLAHPKVCLEPL